MTPEGWSAETLADLAKLITKGTTPTTNGHAYTASGIPFLRVESITDQGSLDLSQVKFISEATHMSLARSQLQPGDVLFSIAGALGRACIVPDTVPKANINQAVALIRLADTSRDLISPSFLKYELHGHVVAQQVRLVAAQLAQANLNLKQVGDLRLLLPPLGEQRKIAAVLSSVDDAIEATQAVIDQLRVVKKATMAELLTRGLPGRHTRFKETEIGEVPEEWEVAPLDAVARVIDPNPSHRYPREIPVGVPLVSTANFYGVDGYDMSGAQHVSEDTFQEQNSRCDFAPDDVVFARKGRIGFARRYGQERKVFSHTVVTMKADPARISPSFLIWFVRSSEFLGQLDRTMNTNSGVPTLGVKIIGDTLVTIPYRDEQDRIATALEHVARRESEEVRVLEGANYVKSALMSVLLTGEVRVTPDEVAA